MKLLLVLLIVACANAAEPAGSTVLKPVGSGSADGSTILKAEGSAAASTEYMKPVKIEGGSPSVCDAPPCEKKCECEKEPCDCKKIETIEPELIDGTPKESSTVTPELKSVCDCLEKPVCPCAPKPAEESSVEHVAPELKKEEECKEDEPACKKEEFVKPELKKEPCECPEKEPQCSMCQLPSNVAVVAGKKA